MGNCIRKESSMQWGGEDWGSPASEHLFSGDTSKLTKKLEEDQRLLEKSSEDFPFHESSSKTPVTEVKIKITKKQLETLLGSTDVQGLSVGQVLAQLMDVSDGYETHQRPWRPVLQSIPEVE
ncbi:unnamed protein product [Ilex paraguariensis]|uniref:Uncharacterized protein n=1 Tax=Ilex paraguariensis TaxID=185542 RepID=A0ABC8U3R1_9AQUA